MTVHLLDVNVLIALVDPAHIEHDAAHAWFARVGRKAFATCPITENGLVRIVEHPKYPNSPGPPGVALQILVGIRGLPGHLFWPAPRVAALQPWIASWQPRRCRRARRRWC